MPNRNTKGEHSQYYTAVWMDTVGNQINISIQTCLHTDNSTNECLEACQEEVFEYRTNLSLLSHRHNCVSYLTHSRTFFYKQTATRDSVQRLATENLPIEIMKTLISTNPSVTSISRAVKESARTSLVLNWSFAHFIFAMLKRAFKMSKVFAIFKFK